MEEYNRSVAKVFWPNQPDSSRIISCSSRLGLSVITLIRQSKVDKPPFQEMWLKQDAIEFDVCGLKYHHPASYTRAYTVHTGYHRIVQITSTEDL